MGWMMGGTTRKSSAEGGKFFRIAENSHLQF
jgi:hypothetical protein